jgi:hypothetical protein
MDGRTDGRTGGQTDGQGDSYIPPPPQTLFAGGINMTQEIDTYGIEPLVLVLLVVS